MRTYKRTHQLLFGAIGLILVLGQGSDSPPALIDHAQKVESALLAFEKEVVKTPTLMEFNGMRVINHAKKDIEPLKREIEAEALRVSKIVGLDYLDEERVVVEAAKRYINLLARTYYLYAKAAHYPKNDITKMSFNQLNDRTGVQLDLKIPQRVGWTVFQTGTYLTPKHDSNDPYFYWFSLPQSDRLLAEMFALSRNEEGDLALTSDYTAIDQSQSELVKRYRDSIYRIGSEEEYARLLQFVALRETLFNRWVINRYRSEQFKETPVNSCGHSGYLNFKTSSSAYAERPSQLLAYTGWAEQEEMIVDLKNARDKISPIVSRVALATDKEHLDVFISLMVSTPGFDLVKQSLQADFDVKPSEEIQFIRYVKKDDHGKNFGERVSQNIRWFWTKAVDATVLQANFPSDPYKPDEMANRVAIFSYEAARDAATSQIATDLINMRFVQEGTDYAQLVLRAEKIYDTKFKSNYLAQIKALTQIPFEQMRNPVIKAQTNKENLDTKAALLFNKVKPILPWIKEYRDLRIYALRAGYVKEYNAQGIPTEAQYEEMLLNQKSLVPHYGRVDSFSAVLMQVRSRLSLKPHQEVVQWFGVDSEFSKLFELWLDDAINEYNALESKSESERPNDMISRALKAATDKLRARAQPRYMVKFGNWVSEKIEMKPGAINWVSNPNEFSKKAKQAIVNWINTPSAERKAVAPSQSSEITEAKKKEIVDWIKKQEVSRPKAEEAQEEKVDPRIHGSIRRDHIATGFVPGPKLEVKVEKLIDALGLSGEIAIDDSKILRTDYDRLQYAHALMAELVVAEPMLGIPMYDRAISLIMDEPATYLGGGLTPGLTGGKADMTKTRSGRAYSVKVEGEMYPQYTQLIEQMGSVYKPLGAPPLKHFEIVYDEALSRQLVERAVNEAAKVGEGLFETFCKADPKNWKEDENFKKIFISSLTLRKAMMGADKHLEEIDKTMRDELRSNMEYLQEEWFVPTMTFLFWASIAFLAVTFPLSPLAAVTAGFVRTVPVLMALANGAMFWGLNGAMVGNMVSRTYVNFYEKPIEVKFAATVAAQNFGNTDKTIMSWAETMNQQQQLKAKQETTVNDNIRDGLFTALFLSQAKMIVGASAMKASEEIALSRPALTAEERLAESLTTKEQVKAFQQIENESLGKPSLMKRVSQDLSRRAGRVMRYLPKYQNFTFSEIMEGVRKTLKLKMPKNVEIMKPELDASIEFLEQRHAASKMRFDEVIANPQLFKWWLRPRVWMRNAKKFVKTGEFKYLNLDRGADSLIERVNTLRRVYIHQKLEMAKSIQAKLVDAMSITDETLSQGDHFINVLTDEEISLLGDLAQGPGLWWNRWYKGNSGPLYLSVARTSENFKTVMSGFSPVEYRPIKPWWETRIDNKQIEEFEKALSGQIRKPNPLKDLDFLEMEAIDSIYQDLVNREIVSSATGQIIKPLSALTEVDKRLLEKYLRGMNFKTGMTQAGLDFKNPADVSEYQDIIEFYDQMQALDGMKVLKDKEYEALRESLEQYLAVPNRSLEQLVNEYKPR